jgi:hypothetical protein
MGRRYEVEEETNKERMVKQVGSGSSGYKWKKDI